MKIFRFDFYPQANKVEKTELFYIHLALAYINKIDIYLSRAVSASLFVLALLTPNILGLNRNPKVS